MLTPKICLLLWICVYVNADDGSNTVDLECKDKLPDCVALATEEFCQSENTEKAESCAHSCGLCTDESSVFNHMARSRSPQAVRARPSSSASRAASKSRSKPAVARSHPTNSRPRAARPKVRQTRQKPRASRTRSTKSRSKSRARPTKSRARPAKTRSKGRSRSQPRNKSPTRSKPKTQQPRELGRGTIEGSPPVFQGTILKMPADARPLSELAETKTSFLRVSLKAHSVANSCGHLMGESQQTSEYADGGSSSYARFVVHMQARWSSEKQWVTKLRGVVEGSEKVVKETGEIKQEMENIVSRMQKHLDHFKDRPNIAKSLSSFSSDFAHTVNAVKKIESTLIPTKDALAEILKNADSTQNNGEEMKKVVQKLRDATATFGKLESEAKALGDELTKVGKDFESNVGAISSQKGDLPSVREPESPKSFEPKNEDSKKEPNQQQSSNNGDPQQPGKENKPSSSSDSQTEQPKMGTIKCRTDSYLANVNNKLACSTTAREEFRVVLVNGQQVKLQTKDNKYCAVLSDESLSCIAEDSETSTVFEKVDNSDRSVSLKCSNGKYLSAPSKNQDMSCSKNAPTENEKFTMDPNQSQPTSNNEQQTSNEKSAEEQLKEPGYNIKCPANGLMFVDPSNAQLRCKSGDKGETMHIIKLDKTFVNLHASDEKKYCSMITTDRSIKCRSDQPDENGKFEMINNEEDGSYLLKCPNGKYLTDVSGYNPKCESTDIKSNNRFRKVTSP